MTPISCLSIHGVICVKELATQCKTFLFSSKVNLFLLTVYYLQEFIQLDESFQVIISYYMKLIHETWE